ncbi:hypothetical protein CCUS01_13249, partial [Colletotrichum cuscutae]
STVARGTDVFPSLSLCFGSTKSTELARNANYSGPLQCLTTTSGTFFFLILTYLTYLPQWVSPLLVCLVILSLHLEEKGETRHSTRDKSPHRFLSLLSLGLQNQPSRGPLVTT